MQPQYAVITDTNLVSLEAMVQKMLAYGFKVAGGISAVFDGQKTHFYQAVTKGQ